MASFLDQYKIKKSLQGSLTDITERSRGDKRGLGGSRVADDAVSELRDRVEYDGGGAIGRRVSYHTLKRKTVWVDNHYIRIIGANIFLIC